MADERALAKRKKGRRLRSLENVRSLVAGVIRQVEAGTMQEDRARLLLYGAQTLSHVIQASQAARETAQAEALRELALQLRAEMNKLREREVVTLPAPREPPNGEDEPE